MILHSEWRDDYRPSRLDAAIDRGFDPGERPEPAPRNVELTPEWARGIESARHNAGVNGCDGCGTRCIDCNERMCIAFGPEPAPRCVDHPTCVDCAEIPDCRECKRVDGLRDFFEPWRHA